MEPDKRHNDDPFPGSMEITGPRPDCTAYRAQTELVEALARLVLDSVAKTAHGDHHGETQSKASRTRLGAAGA